MTLIEPLLADDALRREIDASDPGTGALSWWLGQSGFLIKGGSDRLLLDLYLSDSLTLKYAATDKPHVRMTRRAIAPGELRSITLVTSSHNHTDHLDAETLLAVIDANPAARLVIPEGNRAFVAERLGCAADWPLGLNDGESLRLGDVAVHAVPAAHNEIERDANGRCRYLGYVVQFQGLSIYHSGDTLAYPGMTELLRTFRVDVALLPINGRRPERRVAGNLFGDEAAQLAYDMGARLVVPCHYDMFEFNTEPVDLFVETCQKLGQAYRVLQCGEKFALQGARLGC